MKISSNKITADEAISKVVDVKNQTLNNQSVEISDSNISGLVNGVSLSNQIIGDMSKLVACVYRQADKIPQLADIIERRDQQDAGQWQ